MDWTLTIAIAGLALGLVNSAVQLAGWFSNRARIKIAIAAVIPVRISGLDENQTYLGVTVRNAGHRPTTINAAWLDLPRGPGGGQNNIPLITNPPTMLAPLPKRLDESEEVRLLAAFSAIGPID